ncbi:MAG: hypothetical protein DI636_10345 [Pelagerythrobacter marensis]|nr:MAG: hypothetical protein DI636_10345 [Pelagerythrobacter marensis]
MPNRSSPRFLRAALDPDVGLRILRARLENQMTRSQLAAAARIGSRTLARIERGSQKPRVETVRAIANALGNSLPQLAQGWADDEARYTRNLDRLGRGLRTIRQSRNVTLAAAAGAAGVSSTTLSRFERGLSDSPLISQDGSTFESAKLASLLSFSSVEDLANACNRIS